MDKKFIIIIAAVVVILGSAAAYLLTRDTDNSTSNNSQEQSSNSSKSTEAMGETESTIAKLLGAGVSRECTYSDQSSSGKIYFANNNRMRMDFTSTDPDEGNGGMIITSERQYVWDTDSKEGFSTTYEPSSTEDHSTHSEDADTAESMDMDKPYNFSCSNWSVDQAMFTPPADISFVDMDALMHDHAY